LSTSRHERDGDIMTVVCVCVCVSVASSSSKPSRSAGRAEILTSFLFIKFDLSPSLCHLFCVCLDVSRPPAGPDPLLNL
jgi:hypothetical protein